MAKIPEFTIEKIKDSNDIVDVIGSYLPLKKKGTNYWARCPFHNEKTASFSVSPSKQIYHCFGCGVGGNVLNFVMEYEKLSFIEAVKQLAERASIPLELEDVSPQEQSDTGKLREMHVQAIDIYHQELFKPSGKIALDYLLSRGLSEETIRAFKLGYASESWDLLVSKLSQNYPPDLILKSGLAVRSDKDGRLFDRFRGRVMFPVFDDRGNAVGFGGRLMTNDKKDAKYLNSPETPIYNKRKILYGLHLTRDNIRKEKKAIVVEGYMDFLQLYQHGYINVVAGSGTAFTDEHARLLRRFADEAILCYDSDSAGQKAAVKTGFSVSSQKLECRVLVLPEGEDPDSYLRKEGAEGFFKREATALPFLEFLKFYYQLAPITPTTPATPVIKTPKNGQVYNSTNVKISGIVSPQKKADIISQVTDEIRGFSDPVYREMFAREIAKLFLVDEQTLLNQLNRQNRPAYREEKNIFMGEKPKQFKNQGESAEYFLLQLLVNGNITVRKAGVRYLSPVLYKHPFLKQVLAAILQVLEKNISIVAKHIPDKIQDEKIRNFVIKLLMEEQNLTNQEQIFVESLKQIEMQMLKDDYNELTEQLRTAGPDDIADIMKQQMKNIQARKQLDNQYTLDIFQELDV